MVDCKLILMLVDTQAKVSTEFGSPVVDPTHFKSLTGALQYLTFTRLDIVYAIQQICLHMQDHRGPHLTAMKRTLLYLRGTLNFGLLMQCFASSELMVYTDVVFVGCLDTRRSTSGYAMFLGTNLISWSSKRQNVISHLSVEDEYQAVANGVVEACWLQHLLQHQRTKHVEIDLHFVQKHMEIDDVRVLHEVWPDPLGISPGVVARVSLHRRPWWSDRPPRWSDR
jgi:hypothetical protein